MRTLTASTAIAAPRDAVWHVLSDVVGWPGWLPTVSSVEPLHGAPLDAGFRYVVRQPGLRPATWTVTDIDPPHRFSWETRAPGLRMVADHVLDARGPATCVATLRFTFDGPLGAFVGWYYRKLTQRYLEQEARALRQRAERRS